MAVGGLVADSSIMNGDPNLRTTRLLTFFFSHLVNAVMVVSLADMETQKDRVFVTALS